MQAHLLGGQLSHYLTSELEQSLKCLPQQDLHKEIQERRVCSEEKVYYAFTNHVHQYFNTMWTHNTANNPDYLIGIPGLLQKRQHIICNDLKTDKLSIQHKNYLSPFSDIKQHEHALKHKIQEANEQMEIENKQHKDLKDINAIYEKLLSQQKIKQTEEFVKQKRIEQLERKKKLKQYKMKEEEEQLKNEEEQKHRELEKKLERKQEIRKKKQEGEARRQRQKMLREQRKSEYLQRKQELDRHTPLFKKLQRQFFEKNMKVQAESMEKMHSERKYYLQRYDMNSLHNHDRNYRQVRQQREKQRSERYAQMALQQKQRNRFHSSFQVKKEEDPDEIEKMKAKEKLQKMKQYRAIVRQKFQPKPDEKKKQELQQKIKDMEFKHKKVKRVVRDDGTVDYEIAEPINRKILGVSYLQSLKKIVAESKKNKKKSDDLINSNTEGSLQKKPKHIDYLQQLRQKNRGYHTKSRAKSDFSSMVGRRDISFDDKVKKIMIESEKIEEITKLNEMKLKHGKFMTSEEILACKDEIDQSYLDVVNMKLKLLENQAKPYRKQDDEDL